MMTFIGRFEADEQTECKVRLTVMITPEEGDCDINIEAWKEGATSHDSGWSADCQIPIKQLRALHAFLGMALPFMEDPGV